MKKLVLSLSLVLASGLAIAACNTDQPKSTTPTADGGDAGVVGTDGGAPLAQKDPGEGQPADSGVPPVILDAGPGRSDAGPASTTATNAEPATTGTTDKPAVDDKPPGKPSAWDRVLVKPKDPKVAPDDVKSMVEKKTGLKVTSVRRTAGKWILLQFAPSGDGRNAADQKKLVDVLSGMDAFASVEGDRMMVIK
jgi:hypothetical protein